MAYFLHPFGCKKYIYLDVQFLTVISHDIFGIVFGILINVTLTSIVTNKIN